MLKRIRSRFTMAHMYLLLLFILLLCVFQYGITKIYGMYLYPDEFGYWASAATALGYDWSEIAALGSYYSFGYSVVLLPVLRFMNHATAAYRTAVFLNVIFSGISLCLIFYMLTKICKGAGDKTIACISGIAVFYPSCIYYMQMTMTESLLTVLFLLISVFLLHYIENPGNFTAIGLAVLLVYLYFVHMRTVGIVIACCMTLLVLAVWNRKYRKPLLVFVLAVCVLAVCGVAVKQQLAGTLYSSIKAESLAVNHYAGQAGKIKALLSVKGIYELITSCIGKLFYLGSATFGIFYWGIYFLVKKMAELIGQLRKKEEIHIHTMWFFFFFFAVLFHFMISAVYMMEHAPNGRIDTLIYGRYNDILVPVMLCFGLTAMLKSRHLGKQTVVIIVLQGLSAPFVYGLIRARELTQLYRCHVVGVSYAVNEADFHIELFIRNLFIVSMLVCILITVIVCCIRKKKEWYWLLCTVIAIEVLIGLSASRNEIYKQNEENFRDYELAESITALGREEKEIIFLNPGRDSHISLMQFCLRDTKFTVVDEAGIQPEQLGADELILTVTESPKEKQLEERYDSHLESGNFDLYYNHEKSVKRTSKSAENAD